MAVRMGAAAALRAGPARRRCATCRVPPLLLQPLVENASSTGWSRRSKAAASHVRARREGDGWCSRCATPASGSRGSRRRRRRRLRPGAGARAAGHRCYGDRRPPGPRDGADGPTAARAPRCASCPSTAAAMRSQDPMPATALIAEDEPLLAQALQAELARAWPELRHRRHRRRRPRRRARRRCALLPEVLFLDIRMPGLDGLGAAAELAERWPRGGALPAAGVRDRLRPVRRAGLRGAGRRLRAQAGAARAPAPDRRPAAQALAAQAARRARCRRRDRARVDEALDARWRSCSAPGAGRRRCSERGADPAEADPGRAGGGTVRMVPIDEVLYFEAADKYVRVLTADARVPDPHAAAATAAAARRRGLLAGAPGRGGARHGHRHGAARRGRQAAPDAARAAREAASEPAVRPSVPDPVTRVPTTKKKRPDRGASSICIDGHRTADARGLNPARSAAPRCAPRSAGGSRTACRSPPVMPIASTALGSSPAGRPPRRASAFIIGCLRPMSWAAPASARNSRWRENQATTIAAAKPSTMSSTMVVT